MPAPFAMPRRCLVLLVAPLVFRAPRGLFGPGCLVRPWTAARPRAVRAASFARRVVSKPGQAPPPPTAAAAWPSCALRRPPRRRRCVAGVWMGASSRGPPWPCRHPPAPRPGPDAHGRRSLALLRPPALSTTEGPGVLMCAYASPRCLARPCRRPRAPQPCPVPRSVPCPQFRMQFPDSCSSSLSEKPGISTIIFQSMKCARGNCMRVFGAAGTLIPAGAAAGTREPSVRLSETVIAFARSCSCGIETVIAFVGVKWVFLVQFSGVEVMPVSKSPRCRSSCAKKFARRGLMCA